MSVNDSRGISLGELYGCVSQKVPQKFMCGWSHYKSENNNSPYRILNGLNASGESHPEKYWNFLAKNIINIIIYFEILSYF